MIEKRCSVCKENKSFSNFYTHRSSKDGRHNYCIPCFKLWRNSPERRKKENNRLLERGSQKTPERSAYTRNWQLKNKYGITLEDYNQKLIDQQGKCAICSKDHKDCQNGLYVDHNHDTGLVRELLCRECNSGLGKFKEDITVFSRAISYLEKHKVDNKINIININSKR